MMKCPNCGNTVYERLDFAIVQCTRCLSLWDPYIYPGFPEPDVEPGDIWDLTKSRDKWWQVDEDDFENDDY
jgi:hypothetical protein